MSRLINENYAKHPDRPMIINIGGQGATLATAYGLDSTIADKCIVYYTDLRVYNGPLRVGLTHHSRELPCRKLG